MAARLLPSVYSIILYCMILYYHIAGGKISNLQPCADAATDYANEHLVPVSADGHTTPVIHDQFAAMNIHTQSGASFNCKTHFYKRMNSILRPRAYIES